MAKSPFAMVRNVLLLTMKMKMLAVILGLSLIGTIAEGAPGDQPPKPKMTPDEAFRLLINNGFMARKYYNGVPDPVGVRRVDNRTRMRATITARLNNMMVARVNPLDDETGPFTMEEAIEALDNIFKETDRQNGIVNSDGSGLGFQLYINPFVDPGGVPIDGSGGAGGGTGTGGGTGGGAGACAA